MLLGVDGSELVMTASVIHERLLGLDTCIMATLEGRPQRVS